jgi:hypothetical protein
VQTAALALDGAPPRQWPGAVPHAHFDSPRCPSQCRYNSLSVSIRFQYLKSQSRAATSFILINSNQARSA